MGILCKYKLFKLRWGVLDVLFFARNLSVVLWSVQDSEKMDARVSRTLNILIPVQKVGCLVDSGVSIKTIDCETYV